MTWTDLRLRVRALLSLRRAEQDLQDEIAFHLQMASDKHQQAGNSAGESGRLARARFGSTATVADECRDARGTSFVESALQDLRFACRSFLRSPRFTIPAVVALGLGIGASTAIFSIVHALLLGPLPYGEPDRIVVVWEHNLLRNRPRNVIAPANFVAWLERNRSFDRLGMATSTSLTLMLDGVPDEVPGGVASSQALEALGVQPALGRLFSEEEDLLGHEGVAILSFDAWQQRLGGRTDVLGQVIRVNDMPRTVVGVMPRGFDLVGQRADVIVPYGWTLEGLRTTPGRGASFGIARLKPGVTVDRAAADMRDVAAQLTRENPRLDTGWSVSIVPIAEQLTESIRPALLVLSAGAALLLLIACVNLANLLLARGTVREQEIGVRTALGAWRGRLVRQMVTESLVLAAFGCSAGLLIAVALQQGLIAVAGAYSAGPRLDRITIDFSVLAFAIAVSVITGLVFGAVPAVLASSRSADALRESGRVAGRSGAQRTLGALVMVEVALALVLLTGDGLLIRSLVRLQTVDPGFRTADIVTARVTLPDTRYDSAQRQAALASDLISHMASMPGVTDASGVTFLPLAGGGIGTTAYRTDRPAPEPGHALGVDVRPVMPGFFRTMDIRLRSGRDVSERDTVEGPLVAVVSEQFAREQFSADDPIGRTIHVSAGVPGGVNAQIIGVVGDIRMSRLDAAPRPAIYMPFAQLPYGQITLVVRSSRPSAAVIGRLRERLHEADPELPLAEVQTMSEVVSRALARPQATVAVLSGFALLAVALAGVGVYGVMAYAVSRQTREFGVRMALGASRRNIFALVIGHAARLAVAGVAAGLVIAAGLARLLQALLFETPALDPVSFVTAAGVLFSVAIAASAMPARRSTRITPSEALRTD
jgi:putative ABC transport system permease protein